MLLNGPNKWFPPYWFLIAQHMKYPKIIMRAPVHCFGVVTTLGLQWRPGFDSPRGRSHFMEKKFSFFLEFFLKSACRKLTAILEQNFKVNIDQHTSKTMWFYGLRKKIFGRCLVIQPVYWTMIMMWTVHKIWINDDRKNE